MPVQTASLKKRYGDRRDPMNRIAHAIDLTDTMGFMYTLGLLGPRADSGCCSPVMRKRTVWTESI